MTSTKTCPKAWGSEAPIQHCTLLEGHAGMHEDGRGEEFDGSGRWPGWQPGFLYGETFHETAVDQWRRENGIDPITGERV